MSLLKCLFQQLCSTKLLLCQLQTVARANSTFLEFPAAGAEVQLRMAESRTGEAIEDLENLCQSIEAAISKTPEHVESQLHTAGATTEQIIAALIPDRQRAVWLAELSRIVGDSAVESCEERTEGLQPGGQAEAVDESHRGFNERECLCDQLKIGPPPNAGAHATGGAVGCIHGCGQQFCSASCRRKQVKSHNRVCSAIARKALLKRIGIAADDELF